ncbi:MAG: 2-dehydropantoate 2-reductase [Chloroflexales bacterium]|nr:2-dehydropantoate 2-reductase [Chloroflexales bacterium]
MRIAVVGVGGVGGYFGGQLARAGEDVALIARGAHLAAIQAQGLRVESIAGDFTAHPMIATDDPAEVGPVDAVLVAVKSWQLAAAAAALRPLLGPETAVVPLLNGVEAPEQLAVALGRTHILGGLCRISAAIVAPGVIRHTAVEPTVILGELDNQPSVRATALHVAFTRAGVTAVIADDIQRAMWEKFLLITTWGIGAVTRVPIGAWRSIPETRALAEAAMREVVAVALAHGVALSEDLVAQTLAVFDSLPAETTASMQRDIMAGRPSELEAQNGAVVRLARAVRVPAPTHRFLYASLLPQERQARRGLG